MECLVCNNNSFKKFLSKNKFHPEYLKCKKCGFVFAPPQKDFIYRRFNYAPKKTDETKIRLLNYELRYQLIDKYLNKEKPVFLDVGTNDGIFIKLLKSKNIQSTGIEPNTDAVNHARNNYGISLINAKFEDYNFTKNYDVITLFNVFEHVTNPQEIIEKIKEISSSNALLVLELPNIHYFFPRISFGYWHHFQSTHYWFFNKKTLRIFLEKHGFQLKSMGYIPKIVTYAKVFNIFMKTFKLYRNVSVKRYLKFRESNFYRKLNRRKIKIRSRDYLFAIAEKKIN